MANGENNSSELKTKIEKIILESFKRTRDKNFSDLNFVFPRNKSAIAFLKEKIKIFHNLDEYSQTFLSIYTRAKIALREHQEQNFEGSFLELLRLILTLPEALGNGNLKSTKVTAKEEFDMNTKDVAKELKKYNLGDDLVVIPTQTRKSTYAKVGVSGKKLIKQKQEKQIDLEELNEIDFEDEEYDNEIDNLDDVNL